MDEDVSQSLYTVFRSCRFCGGGGGYKMPIVQNVVNIDGSDVDLRHKIRECLQMEVNFGDKLPPLICELCVDKLNDFYEFYDMCRQQVNKTRSMLGLPPQPSPMASTSSADPGGDCILGVTEPVYVNSSGDEIEEVPVENSRPGPKSVKLKKAKAKEQQVKLKIAPIKEPDTSSPLHSRLGKREEPKVSGSENKEEKINKEDKSERKDIKKKEDKSERKDIKNKEDKSEKKDIKNKEEKSNKDGKDKSDKEDGHSKDGKFKEDKPSKNKEDRKRKEDHKKKVDTISLGQLQRNTREGNKAQKKNEDKMPLSEIQKKKEDKHSHSNSEKKEDKIPLSEILKKREDEMSLSKIKEKEKARRSFNRPSTPTKRAKPTRSSIIKMVKDEIPDVELEEDALLAVRSTRPREVYFGSTNSRKSRSRSSVTPNSSPQSSPASSRASTPAHPSPARNKLSCKICAHNPKTTQGLTAHLRSHTVTYTISGWECNACGEWFESSLEYDSHHESHKSYVCKRRCGDKFKLYQAFNDHIPECVKRLELPDIECTACLKFFPTVNLRDTHKCPVSKKSVFCETCNKGFANSKGLSYHKKLSSCSQKQHNKSTEKTENIDPRVQPVQVRIKRCDKLLNKIKDHKGHYDVFMVPYDYGTDEKCYYPYILRGLKRESIWESIGMVNISDEIKSEFSKKRPKGELVHWDSSDTESEEELDKPRNPKSLAAIAIKRIYSEECMGRVPKKRRKVKKENDFDDVDNNIDTDINSIISNLDVYNENDKSNAAVNRRDSFDDMFKKKEVDQVTNNDFDSLFGGNALPVDSTNKKVDHASVPNGDNHKKSTNSELASSPRKKVDIANEKLRMNGTDSHQEISRDVKMNNFENSKDIVYANGLIDEKQTVNGAKNDVNYIMDAKL